MNRKIKGLETSAGARKKEITQLKILINKGYGKIDQIHYFCKLFVLQIYYTF